MRDALKWKRRKDGSYHSGRWQIRKRDRMWALCFPDHGGFLYFDYLRWAKEEAERLTFEYRAARAQDRSVLP